VVSQESIRDVSDRIARHFGPERIILFGSYAYGSPTEESDVDLLVILRYEGSSRRAASAIRRQVRPDFALDILTYRPGEVERRAAMEDFFVREVLERGKVLYEADHAGMDREG